MDAKEGAEKAKEQAEKIMSQMKKMPSGGGKALAGLAAVAAGGYCIFNYGIFNGSLRTPVARRRTRRRTRVRKSRASQRGRLFPSAITSPLPARGRRRRRGASSVPRFAVDSGHRAVMYNRVGGISEKTYGEGALSATAASIFGKAHLVSVPLQGHISRCRGSNGQSFMISAPSRATYRPSPALAICRWST